MEEFDVGLTQALPSMVIDRGASDEGRLVFVRGPRRSCGVIVGILGAAVLAGAVALALGVARPEARSALLALGGFAAVVAALVGTVLATARHRLIVDKGAGLLIGSRWFLGIENPVKKPIGNAPSVSWSREVRHTGGGTSPPQEHISFPVLLHSTVGGRSRTLRVFMATGEDDARRLARELGAFLGDAGATA